MASMIRLSYAILTVMKPQKNMYEKLGFYLTGECDEDEIMMEKALR